MKNIKDDYCCLIHGWMLRTSCSNWNELAVYALVYDLSQGGKIEFPMSISYVREWLMCCKQTAVTTMKRLEEKGLIVKTQHETDGVVSNRYSAIKPNFVI